LTAKASQDYYAVNWKTCQIFDEFGEKSHFGKEQQVLRPGSKVIFQAADPAGRLNTRKSRLVPHNFGSTLTN
jgi:hypothetical protein